MLPAEEQAFVELRQEMNAWAHALGFQALGVTDSVPAAHIQHYRNWLGKQYQGEMSYLSDRRTLREDPEALQPGCIRIISVRMDYKTETTLPKALLKDPDKAYIARYSLGRDYHKVIRQRLKQLWVQMNDFLQQRGLDHFSARGFTDSAPILEKALAEKAGLGWIGKNTLLINEQAGSLFFIGEILTDVPLPLDTAYAGNHCGSCSNCLEICPTQAFVAPYELDARRCISYLTIESGGPIPEQFRQAMGNRIFGCDDCQLFCPWNKFAQHSREADFSPRHQLDEATLLSLFAWDESTFLEKTAGSAIRRTGYQGWQRNIATALGNGAANPPVIAALQAAKANATDLVAEHIDWALNQLASRRVIVKV